MRRRPLALAALAVLIPAAPAAAQSTAPPIAYDTFSLSNGLKFVVHEDHSTPIVSVNVWYDVGSAHEPPGRSGFAHFFEHMLFQETENLEHGQFQELVRRAGGSYNGTTNTDRTAYFETLPSNRLNLALWLEAERMARLTVTEANFQREREVVKEERRMRIENQPYADAILSLDTIAHDWQPYKHTVIGSMDDLNAAAVEDVRSFYEEYYVPNNATVVVAGDVEPQEVRQLAQRYFGDIPPGPAPAPLPQMPPAPRTDGERTLVMHDRLANLPLMAIAFNLPPHRHPDSYALGILSRILSAGESSRLHQRLVKDEQAALQAGFQMDSRWGPSLAFAFALPNQGVELERLQTLLEEEIEKLRTEGVTQRELDKAKNQARAAQIMGRQTVESRAWELHHFRLLHGDISDINEDLDRTLDVTAEDVLRVARKYLVPENRTVLHVLPGEAPAQPAAGKESTE